MPLDNGDVERMLQEYLAYARGLEQQAQRLATATTNTQQYGNWTAYNRYTMTPEQAAVMPDGDWRNTPFAPLAPPAPVEEKMQKGDGGIRPEWRRPGEIYCADVRRLKRGDRVIFYESEYTHKGWWGSVWVVRNVGNTNIDGQTVSVGVDGVLEEYRDPNTERLLGRLGDLQPTMAYVRTVRRILTK